MRQETALIWSWLNVLNKKRYEALNSVYGNLNDAIQHIDEELLKGFGCKQETIYTVLNRFDEFDVDQYKKELEKRGLSLISIEDDAYPPALQSIDDPPIFLYYKGSLDVLSQPCIALVGTRSMTSYGERVTEKFVSSFTGAGMVTVSGLALGIDTAVAKESLSNNGKTVAVLAHGLAQISPSSNKKLADEIVDAGGLLLSEYPLDQMPDVYTFPARNRIVAALSLATVVLEAPEGSGALITANLAFDYSREVFAVPGQVFDENYAGCHRIISDGKAKIASDPSSVLKEVGVVTPQRGQKSNYEPEDAEESVIWKALTSMPQGIDDLTEKSGLDAAAINAKLTMMELQGVVQKVGVGWAKK